MKNKFFFRNGITWANGTTGLFCRIFVLAWGCSCSHADVAFVNGFTNPVTVTGAVELTLQPGQSFSFTPASDATNDVTLAGSTFALQDGSLYGVSPDGDVTVSSVLRSSYDDDSVMASYFTNGLEMGTGLAAVLFGWGFVKRALRLGDSMPE